MKNRVSEFIYLYTHGDGGCTCKLLTAYCDKHKISRADRFDIAYFFSVTYSVQGAIILYQNRDKIIKNTRNWVKENKEKILFISDRKYVKIGDRFEKCLIDWRDNLRDKEPMKSAVKGNKINLKNAIKISSSWYFFARFSSYLFVEHYTPLLGYEYENTTIDWKNGDTETSGLMNVFGFDKSADYFDKYNKIINLRIEDLDFMFSRLLSEIRKVGAIDDATRVGARLCGYRKHFKGARYNGYYLDRQQEELNYYKQTGFKDLSNELFDLRGELFEKKYLGEYNGWCGIQKDRKKLYVEKGIIL